MGQVIRGEYKQEPPIRIKILNNEKQEPPYRIETQNT